MHSDRLGYPHIAAYVPAADTHTMTITAGVSTVCAAELMLSLQLTLNWVHSHAKVFITAWPHGIKVRITETAGF